MSEYIEDRLSRVENILHTLLYDHPEICPHDLELQYIKGNIAYYKCSLCGKTFKEEA